LSIFSRYMLRLARKRWLIRAFRKRRELRVVADRTKAITPEALLVYSTLRNERIRLPHFLRYYRDMGVNHFLIVDNDSDDGSRDYLAEQPDVSLWTTRHSYKRSRFGVDWLNWLQFKYGHDHWCLVVDPDEFFVYPFCDTRPLRALTDWLDASSIKSFSAMLLDMYPKGPFDATRLTAKVRIRLKSPSGSTAATIRSSATRNTATCGFRVGRARGCSSPTCPNARRH
jgi:hypothetical protein